MSTASSIEVRANPAVDGVAGKIEVYFTTPTGLYGSVQKGSDGLSFSSFSLVSAPASDAGVELAADVAPTVVWLGDGSVAAYMVTNTSQVSF